MDQPTEAAAGVTACNECWDRSYVLARTLGGFQVDRYKEELARHPEHDSHGTFTSTATVDAVAPQKRGTVSDEDRAAIASALEARERADQAVRDAVLAAVANGASVRELDALDGISGATVSRWKRESSSP